MNESTKPGFARQRADGYIDEFTRAVAFTRSLGLTRRTGFKPSARIIENKFSEIVREWARLNICCRSDERLAGMCMQITWELMRFLEGGGIPSIYTLGWMSYSSQPIYKFGHEQVNHWLLHGISSDVQVDIHAWVTLSSGEIIDPSWLSTVGIVQNKRELVGAVITADPDQTSSHQYHPITVDTDILFALGLLNSGHRASVVRQAAPDPTRIPAIA